MHRPYGMEIAGDDSLFRPGFPGRIRFLIGDIEQNH